MPIRIKTIVLTALFALLCTGLCEAQTVFYPVTSTSDLKDGDVVVLVSKAASAAMNKTISGSSSIDTVNVKFSGDNVLVTDDVLQLTLHADGKYWTLSSDNGYLCTTSTDKALTQTKKSKVDDYCKASISFDSSNGGAIICFKKRPKFQIGYNYESAVFKTYQTLLNDGEVYMYSSSNVITLDGDSQTADNGGTLASLTVGEQYDVRVARSFTGDGGWYTLCLPFALTADDIATTFLGADFYEYKSVSIGELDEACLNFEKVSATTAGVPYLLMMKDGTTVENPLFASKTIEQTTPRSITFATDDSRECSFVGIFDPTDIASNDMARFVSAKGNSLAKSNGDGTKLKGLRAYFIMPATVAEAKVSPVAGGATSVPPPIINELRRRDVVFDIVGRRVNATVGTLPKGIYIVNGKQRVVSGSAHAADK